MRFHLVLSCPVLSWFWEMTFYPDFVLILGNGVLSGLNFGERHFGNDVLSGLNFVKCNFGK